MILLNKQIFVHLIGATLLLFFYSCSSSTEAERNGEDVRYEKPEKVIKNIEFDERNYISLSKIKTIEKISFELTPKGKPVNGEKLVTQNYNQDGFLIETIAYNKDASIQYKYKYEYDNNGVRVRTKRYNSSGKMVSYYKYDYNKFGNKTRAYRYDPNGRLEEYYVYNYDGEGNLTEEEWFSASGEEIYNVETDYDNSTKTRTYTYDEDGNLIYEYVFRYDGKGNILEESKYNNSNTQVGIIQYVYKHY
jgi:hypothetical protein